MSIADLSSVKKLIKGGTEENAYATGRPPSGKLSGYSARRTHQGSISERQRQQHPAQVVLPGDVCPSCLMPFDANRKRRLIDSCGHERCYACLFSSGEACPLCSTGKKRFDIITRRNAPLSRYRSNRTCREFRISPRHSPAA